MECSLNRPGVFLLLALAAALSACGGGRELPPNYQVKVSLTTAEPAQLMLSTDEQGNLPATHITIKASGNVHSLLGNVPVVRVDDAQGIFPQAKVLHYDRKEMSATLGFDRSAIDTSRPSQGVLEIHACVDAACKYEFINSPLKVPYQITPRQYTFASIAKDQIHATAQGGAIAMYGYSGSADLPLLGKVETRIAASDAQPYLYVPASFPAGAAYSGFAARIKLKGNTSLFPEAGQTEDPASRKTIDVSAYNQIELMIGSSTGSATLALMDEQVGLGQGCTGTVTLNGLTPEPQLRKVFLYAFAVPRRCSDGGSDWPSTKTKFFALDVINDANTGDASLAIGSVRFSKGERRLAIGADGLSYGKDTPEHCTSGLDCGGNLAELFAAPTRAKAFGYKQTLAAYGNYVVDRRYLLYVPPGLPTDQAVPLVWVFHGGNVEAETTAYYDTYNGFENLADKEKFIVVYGNGLSFGAAGGWQYSSAWYQCIGSIDIDYVKEVNALLASRHGLKIDPQRIYATGPSNGGGMTLSLVMEAPELFAAVAPAVPAPVSPSNPMGCTAKEGFNKVPMLLMAATSDPLIPYDSVPGNPFSGMEALRDDWLAAMSIFGAPSVSQLPDLVSGDSLTQASSYFELQKYPPGPQGQRLWFYRAVGAGHALPHPVQLWDGNWSVLGKRNQDAHWADLTWEFFKMHVKH